MPGRRRGRVPPAPWVNVVANPHGGFVVSERGRFWPDNSEDKGRFLSAGYHNSGGYYRDDAALTELILRRDASYLLRRLEHERPVVTAQQYIEGRPANFATACWRGESLAGIGVRVLQSAGETGPATVV